MSSAKDLAGKRIGVPLYTQTAALFVRGLMQHDLGIDLSGIEWVQGSVNEPGAYGNPAVMPMLKPVNLSGIFDLGPLNQALAAAGQPQVSS